MDISVKGSERMTIQRWFKKIQGLRSEKLPGAGADVFCHFHSYETRTRQRATGGRLWTDNLPGGFATQNLELKGIGTSPVLDSNVESCRILSNPVIIVIWMRIGFKHLRAEAFVSLWNVSSMRKKRNLHSPTEMKAWVELSCRLHFALLSCLVFRQVRGQVIRD